MDADSGLVHTVRGTAANVSDDLEANSLLHRQEADGYGDASYQSVDKRADVPKTVKWHTAMKRSKRTALELLKPIAALQEQIEQSSPASWPRSNTHSESSNASSVMSRHATEA